MIRITPAQSAVLATIDRFGFGISTSKRTNLTRVSVSAQSASALVKAGVLVSDSDGFTRRAIPADYVMGRVSKPISAVRSAA